MPIFQPQLVTGEIYHIFNRGVEKRNIFNEEKDYFRFIHDLWEFNDKNATINTSFYLNKAHYRDTFSIVEGNKTEKAPRKLLIEILGFSLMPNHYHLLLRQLVENGISIFMRKLGGYSLYFNKKYDRVGPLFQGRYKRVHIETDAQLTAIINYIHLNRAEIIESKWKEQIFNPEKIINFLENDRFSSYQDYIGKKNFPSVTNREFLMEVFGELKEFKRDIKEKIFEQAKLNKFFKDHESLFLE